MPSVDPETPVVNDQSHGQPPSPPPPASLSLETLRESALETLALAAVVADALTALPEGAVPETLQVLAVVCERAARGMLERIDAEMKRVE